MGAKPRDSEERNNGDDLHETNWAQCEPQCLATGPRLRLFPDRCRIGKDGSFPIGQSAAVTQEFGDKQDLGAGRTLLRMQRGFAVHSCVADRSRGLIFPLAEDVVHCDCPLLEELPRIKLASLCRARKRSRRILVWRRPVASEIS